MREQPSGGDGAMTKAREYLSDPDFIARSMYLAKRHEPAYRPALGFAVCALCDQTYPCMPAVMLAEVERLQARLAAAKRVVAAVRAQVPGWAWRKYRDDPSLLGSLYDMHQVNIISAVLAYDATTHPNDGGDE